MRLNEVAVAKFGPGFHFGMHELPEDHEFGPDLNMDMTSLFLKISVYAFTD